MRTLTEDLKAEAQRLGFALTGVCPAVTPTGITRFRDWLAAGYAGEMRYLPDRAAAYADPNYVLDGVRSILMLGMHYANNVASPPSRGFGRISRYAWGSGDYHDLIHARLKELAAHLVERSPTSAVRGVVDTAPLLEREFAQLAGLGWIGKNTMLISQHSGSYFFLAALLTDASLDCDPPQASDHCGTCTACLDACPTDAFPEPYVLDATRCLSYTTIEQRTLPTTELRELTDSWLFGCDICQEVCPWNRHAPGTKESELLPTQAANAIELASLFSMSDDDFRARFRRTPLWRSKRRGILRNAAIVLGNQGHPDALPLLERALEDDEPLVRDAVKWAVGKLQRVES